MTTRSKIFQTGANSPEHTAGKVDAIFCLSLQTDKQQFSEQYPSMKFVAIIPARYGSSRFPGKPLALLGGEPVISHVCRRAAMALGADNVLVATDDDRIAAAVNEYGGRAVMTSTEHRSGTDRIAEALERSGVEADVVINVQGDEPFVHPEQLKALMACFDRPEVKIATLVRPWPEDADATPLTNPNIVKVVVDDNGNALYFSRSLIPFRRADVTTPIEYLTHVGVYAYRADVLRRIVTLPRSPLEQAESLEQLRWLQAGYTIATARTGHQTVGIDTPADLERAERFLTGQTEI